MRAVIFNLIFMELLSAFLPALGGLQLEVGSETGVVIVQLIVLGVAAYFLLTMVIPMLRGTIEKALPNVGELFTSLTEWIVYLAVLQGILRLIIEGFFGNMPKVVSYLETLYIALNLGWFALGTLVSLIGAILLLAIARRLAK